MLSQQSLIDCAKLLLTSVKSDRASPKSLHSSWWRISSFFDFTTTTSCWLCFLHLLLKTHTSLRKLKQFIFNLPRFWDTNALSGCTYTLTPSWVHRWQSDLYPWVWAVKSSFISFSFYYTEWKLLKGKNSTISIVSSTYPDLQLHISNPDPLPDLVQLFSTKWDGTLSTLNYLTTNPIDAWGMFTYFIVALIKVTVDVSVKCLNCDHSSKVQRDVMQ